MGPENIHDDLLILIEKMQCMCIYYDGKYFYVPDHRTGLFTTIRFKPYTAIGARGKG